MSNRFRRITAGFATAGLALTLALPASADRVAEVANAPTTVPVVFDVVFMRPLGLLATAVGACFYLFPVVPLMAITRPSDITKPLGPLVGDPARFTFKDPIGHHPQQF